MECNSASVKVYGKNITSIRRKILKRCLKLGKPLQTNDTLNNEFNDVGKIIPEDVFSTASVGTLRAGDRQKKQSVEP